MIDPYRGLFYSIENPRNSAGTGIVSNRLADDNIMHWWRINMLILRATMALGSYPIALASTLVTGTGMSPILFARA